MISDGYMAWVGSPLNYQMNDNTFQEGQVVGFVRSIDGDLVNVITAGNTVHTMYRASNSQLTIGDAVQVDESGHVVPAGSYRADYDTPIGGFHYDRPLSSGANPVHINSIINKSYEKILELDAKLTEAQLVIRKLYRRNCSEKICGYKSKTPAEYCEYHNELAVLLAHLEE